MQDSKREQASDEHETDAIHRARERLEAWVEDPPERVERVEFSTVDMDGGAWAVYERAGRMVVAEIVAADDEGSRVVARDTIPLETPTGKTLHRLKVQAEALGSLAARAPLSIEEVDSEEAGAVLGEAFCRGIGRPEGLDPASIATWLQQAIDGRR